MYIHGGREVMYNSWFNLFQTCLCLLTNHNGFKTILFLNTYRQMSVCVLITVYLWSVMVLFLYECSIFCYLNFILILISASYLFLTIVVRTCVLDIKFGSQLNNWFVYGQQKKNTFPILTPCFSVWTPETNNNLCRIFTQLSCLKITLWHLFMTIIIRFVLITQREGNVLTHLFI